MEEFPEEKGYMAQPGWVKGNPLNNPIYVQRCVEAYPEWADVIKAIDAYLTVVVPGYNITQVKDKFGGMRFYWTAPADADKDDALFARDVVYQLEGLAPQLRPRD